MTDELIKTLLNASVDTLLAISLVLSLYFLTRSRANSTTDESETLRRREENDGKLIDAIAKNADTQSGMKELLAKAVELQADTVEWHKSHAKSLEDTNGAIIVLQKDIRTRSELDGQAFSEMREKVKTDIGSVKLDIKGLKDDITDLRNEIDKLVNDKLKCAGLDAKIEKVLNHLDNLAKQPASAVSSVTVNTTPATITQDDGDVKKEAAA